MALPPDERIVIVLPFPPSSNSAYPSGKNGRRFMSKAGAAWKLAAYPMATSSLGDWLAPECIMMSFWLAFPDKRKRDLNNYVKLPQDLVCEAWGIDDNHFMIPEIRMISMGVNRANAHCRIEIVSVHRKD
ncbi:MAG: RusA family crossover junction endodeoxyribonuclease [Deltaproteobacteria bacterium]|nr:RusA family crossover junction endodeoxyribonuclease [Deltaproteobacteria bacterium]